MVMVEGMVEDTATNTKILKLETECQVVEKAT